MVNASLIMAASGGGGIVQILVIIVFVVIGLVSKLAKKKQEEQKPPPREAPRQPPPPTQHNRPTRPALPLPQRQSMTGDSFSQPSERRIPQQQRTARPGFSVEEHVRTVRDQTDLDVVDEQADRHRLELEQKDATRLRRLQTAAPAEADTAAIDARISHFQRMEVQADQVSRVQVNLSSRRTLRDAIIFYEILSRPKALRDAPELWDQ